jgi:hypothetical protein
LRFAAIPLNLFFPGKSRINRCVLSVPVQSQWLSSDSPNSLSETIPVRRLLFRRTVLLPPQPLCLRAHGAPQLFGFRHHATPPIRQTVAFMPHLGDVAQSEPNQSDAVATPLGS